MTKKRLFVYNFANCKGFHIFASKQIMNTYINNQVLYADTKKQALDLIKERIPKTKEVLFMRFDNKKQDFVEQDLILL